VEAGAPAKCESRRTTNKWRHTRRGIVVFATCFHQLPKIVSAEFNGEERFTLHLATKQKWFFEDNTGTKREKEAGLLEGKEFVM